MRRILHLLLVLIPCCSFGQQMSIQDLWNQVDKDLTAQQRHYEMKAKQEELNELKINRIPLFYVDANIQRNLIIPTTPVPAIAFDPSAKDGAIIPLKFATKWSSKAGLQLEWEIFDPKQKLEEQQRELAIEKSKVTLESHKQEWRQNATLAYAAVILASEQYFLAQQDSIRYAEIVNTVKLRYEEGREKHIDYLNARQEFERKRIQLHEAWAVLTDADLELRNYSDMGAVQQLTSSVDRIVTLLAHYNNQNYNLSTLNIDLKDYALQQKAIKKQLYPSLKLNAYLGEQYYSNEFRLARGTEWYGNSYVNLALYMPLSALFTYGPTVRKITWQSSATALKVQKEQQQDEIKSAQKSTKVLAAKQKLIRLKEIHLLAVEAQKEQNSSYQEGRTLLSDLNQTILQANQAQRAIWQQYYELITLLME